MRLPDTAHTSRPWRIHELTGDFRLEDVWALPTPGGPDDFPRLVQWWASRGDPSRASASCAVRTLWAIRWKAGELLGWDGPDAGPGSERPTLRDRLPADLREAPPGPDFAGLPFTSLYLTGDEWAAEIVNRTVHGVMHLGWVPDGTGGHRGQMAVLVKPNGLLGTGYMAAIRPFRHLIVYPPMLREIGRGWQALPGDPAPDLPITAPGTSVKEEIDVTAGTDSHPRDPHVAAPGTVRQVTLPPAARALSTLSHLDYEDAFLVETGPAQDRTGEQWARAILEDAPMSTRKRSGSAEAEAALSRQARYKDVAGNLKVKEVSIAEDERFIICHNPEGAERDDAVRARMRHAGRRARQPGSRRGRAHRRRALAQPRRGLRPARRSGLASPDPVRTPKATTATRTPDPGPEPVDKPQNQSAAVKTRPKPARGR